MTNFEHTSRREAGPAATIREYYETLRAGEALSPYFATDPNAVKFGITEHLDGYEEIAAGLRSQTETTTDWHIESHGLVVGERDAHAWFGDRVSMAWTDTATGERHDYETRWSGTLERQEDSGGEDHGDDDTDGDSDANGDDGPPANWRFVSMHVSRSES